MKLIFDSAEDRKFVDDGNALHLKDYIVITKKTWDKLNGQ